MCKADLVTGLAGSPLFPAPRGGRFSDNSDPRPLRPPRLARCSQPILTRQRLQLCLGAEGFGVRSARSLLLPQALPQWNPAGSGDPSPRCPPGPALHRVSSRSQTFRAPRTP